MQAGKLQPIPQEKMPQPETLAHREIMSHWAGLLQGWGLHQLAAVLLDAAGPLNIVGAQLVYLSQPILNGFLDDSSLSSLAWMLEERDQTKTFIQLLREEPR